MDLPIGLAVADSTVVLDGVDPTLMAYAEHLGLLHRILFGKPLTITSGFDGKHVQNSYHQKGLALDVRTQDLDLEEQGLLLALISFSAPLKEIAVFDERGVAGSPHVHLEYHGA